MNSKEISYYKKAGEIASQVTSYAKKLIKPGMLLLEIADKIESEVEKLGGKPAFPCNLSMNEIAAHYTPSYNDKTQAQGLLKIDFGVHVNGYIADTAFSMDLESSEENKKLIEASEQALHSALNYVKENKTIKINEIGRIIHHEITTRGFSPVRNLSGHSLDKNTIHAGITLPNYDNRNEKVLEKGAYAIEPFATNGSGLVYDSSPSSIYRLEKVSGVRDMLARKILDFIQEKYSTLPFCSRWIVREFSPRALFSLSLLEKAGIIYQYPQLIEKSHKKVSQSEHTFILNEKVEVTTN